MEKYSVKRHRLRTEHYFSKFTFMEASTTVFDAGANMFDETEDEEHFAEQTNETEFQLVCSRKTRSLSFH